MSLRWRILIGFIFLFTAGSVLIMELVVSEVRPRYLEAVEESLNDTAHILASFLESELKDGRIDVKAMDATFSRVYRRRFHARIYDITKTKVSLNVYVTDSKGIVIYDTEGSHSVGKDFSHWRDVALTLSGHYGARATRTDPDDPASSLLHVAAPVTCNGSTIGVVTVVKAQDSVSLFIDLARRRFLLAGSIIFIVAILLSLVMTFWISRPLGKLSGYVKRIRETGIALKPETGVPELQHLADAMAEMVLELEGKRYVEHYVQALTHELKSPLSSIRGAAELLSEDMPPEQRRKFLENISGESRRMTMLIERMLNLASLEGRSALENPQSFSLAKLCREVLFSLEPQAVAKDVTFSGDIVISRLFTGEEFLIHQVLVNLVQNGLDAVPRGGVITITGRQENDAAYIIVHNTGEHIPHYALDKIFHRFYSLPHRDGKKGSGLGLAFSKQAVELHDGTLEILNNPSGGVDAKISLPL